MFRKSVPKPAPGAGAPQSKSPLITLVYSDDILVFPGDDETGVTAQGNIVLIDGANMFQVYATAESQKASHTIEGEADAEGIMKKFEFSHPGDSIEFSEFVQKSLGQGIVAVYPTDCGVNTKKVVGTRCNPLFLKGEFSDDKDAVKHTITLEQRKRDKYVSKFYSGELTYAQNYVSATAALAITAANGYVYKLPPSSVANTLVTVSSLTIATRKVITLIGSGGSNPALLVGGATERVTVLLHEGSNWTALKDASINLQLFDDGDVKYLIELSRS